MNIPRVGLLAVEIASILFAAGCAGGQAGPTPGINATVEARVEPAETSSGSEVFWNRAMVGEDGEPLPSCGDSIFTHPVVDLEDANPFFLVNKGYPHDHMVYWGTRKFYDRESPPPVGVLGTEQVQLYAPADIYYMQVSRSVNESHDGGTFEEWSIGASICEGYKLGFGHVGRPVEEILSEVKKLVPYTDCPVSTTEEALVTTEVGDCQWGLFFNPPFSAGTPISKSSGYAAGFDFGLKLLGLTAEELRQQPSYGYAINPWAYSGGVAVCPLEYFPEPYRTAYLDSMAGRCGPFNQDVPGTAMGVWLPFPPPADGSVPSGGPGTVWHFLPRESDLYLWEDSVDESVHKLISGGQLTGVPANAHRRYR